MSREKETRVCRRAGSRVGSSPRDELEVGERIADRYTIARRLGAGGMGSVYEAFDPRTSRTVALKILAAELSKRPTFAERFAREARVTAALDHPNVIQVHEVGEHQGRPFLVMDYLAGETLEQRLSRDGSLPVHEVRSIARQVCAGLAYVHRKGLVHRDLKTANVMLAGDGHATLLDFGVMRDASEASLTMDGCTVGTPGYMAPEQALGDKALDGRADQYALACLLFELLCGRLPFEETNDARRLTRQLREAPPDVRTFAPLVPEAVAKVLSRALASTPEGRFPTIEAFAQALERAAENNEVALEAPRFEGPRDEPEPAQRAAHRPPSWSGWAAAIALLVAGLALLGGHAHRHPGSEASPASEAPSGLPR